MCQTQTKKQKLVYAGILYPAQKHCVFYAGLRSSRRLRDSLRFPNRRSNKPEHINL
jgi:hypothetical protein